MKEYWDKNVYPFKNDYKCFKDFCDTFTAPPSYLMLSGVRRFLDQTTDAVNTKNGIRVTTNQPQKHKRAIYLVGPCTLYGWGADDAHTPASLLQKN